MKLTIPTWLTLLRILMIPVLVLVFYLPYKWTNFAATAVFGLAAITDWLDGWIARRYHQYSAFGAFLDPVADKLMVAVALFLIVQGHPTAWMALWRSEEHTSELKSLMRNSYAVFCLKKKKHNTLHLSLIHLHNYSICIH